MSSRLVEATSSFLAGRTSRRSFIVRFAVAGSAMAVAPLRYVLRPGTAYAAVCGPDATCASGYTAMCCTVSGTNRCPPGSFPGGWWKADNSGLCCGNTSRYYIDCNMQCGQSCPCHCASGSCDQRKTCCNQFRYGQCHQEIACYGPIACRVVSCNPPWMFDATCGTTVMVDPNTAQHTAPCLPGSCSTPIDGHWYTLGADQGFLGWPVSAQLATGPGSGSYRNYEGGSIYFSSSTGAHEVHGGVRDTWTANGGVTGFLGYPLTDALVTADGAGRYEQFQGGSIYWSSGTGAHEVHGAIRDEWATLGYENGFLGYPLTDALTPSDGVGRYNDFQGGSIYWSAATGAHEVHGAIRDAWTANGRSAGFLGYPTADAVAAADGAGRLQQFQGGTVYWSAATGAHEVHGAIRDLWTADGGVTGFLGYPTSDAAATPDGAGRAEPFQGGTIYWSAATGAHELHGAIGDKYALLNTTASVLKFPVTDVVATPDGAGRSATFQGGAIYWSTASGAHELYGPILDRYKVEGETGSSLGYPISDVTTVPIGQRCKFQHGSIVWDKATGTTKVTHK